MWKNGKIPQNKVSYFSLLAVFLIIGSFLFSQNIEAQVQEEISKEINDKDQAQEEALILENEYFSIQLDQETIAKGYTVSAFDEKMKLSLTPGILSASTEVKTILLREEMMMPWQLDPVSQVYLFEFINKEAYDNHRPFYIQLSYEADDNNHKKVFFYDRNFDLWRPLPTKDYPQEKFVRSLIHLPYARIAVFSYPRILTSGQASWYRYKGGDFAASPDFPRGSVLRVHNPQNGKFVDVEINDFGPDRKIHPNRPIDLDRVAFSKIADLRDGLTEVVIEPLKIVPDRSGFELGLNPTGAGSGVDSGARSAIVYRENDGLILYEKNSTTTAPIASLTKIVAIKTFLNTNTPLDKIEIYRLQDEEYNHQYVRHWESARLRLEEGDALTVENLLYSSLVGSTNNTVETLARASGLAREKFIENMNLLVQEWGAGSTKFVEPSGLSAENVSSPMDYAIITKEAFKDPIISAASIMPRYEFSTLSGDKSFRFNNTNAIIQKNQYQIVGSKTGFINKAGYCLVVKVRDEEKGDFIVVTLGGEDRSGSFYETEKLINYGLRSNK